jgi:hypothetical protein
MRLSAFGPRSIVVLIVILFQYSTALAAPSGKSSRRNYFGFGPGYFSNMNSRNMATLISGGFAWSIDPQFDLYLVADLAFSFKHNDVRYLTPQLKGRYMFNPEENGSWYVGAGMGIGHGATHESAGKPSDSVTGFAISGAFGYKAYQKGAMQLIFEVDHSMVLSESSAGTPILTSFKVGILFP